MQVAIIGDYDAEFEPHRATEAAIAHAAEFLRVEIEVTWIATDSIGQKPESQFARLDAFWIAPGSPYRSMSGVLTAIRLAREEDTPLLGTCGGLQHMIVEFARNVLGLVDATHAEYEPNASRLFVAPLSCSLAGKEMQVTITPGSQAAIAYGVLQATESYYCNFGLNPAYQSQLHDGGFRIVGVDADGEARILEIPQRRFFVGTLFVPQIRSQPGAPHPLVVAFLQAGLGGP